MKNKFDKIFCPTIALGVVGLTSLSFVPLFEIFPAQMYVWVRIAIPVLLLMGCFGQLKGSKKLLLMGVFGCYFLVGVIIGTLAPDEEFYYLNDIPLPSKYFIVCRTVLLTFVVLFLLKNFRNCIKLAETIDKGATKSQRGRSE